jgi:hypothetical protein
MQTSKDFKKAGIPTSHKNDIQLAIQDALTTATKKYYEVKKNAKDYRETHLENLASDMAAQGNLTKQNIIKQLRMREQQRHTARKIKFLRGKLTKKATTTITVNIQDGSIADVTDKRQIENEIIASNKRKFQQSFSTPFYTPPLTKFRVPRFDNSFTKST